MNVSVKGNEETNLPRRRETLPRRPLTIDPIGSIAVCRADARGLRGKARGTTHRETSTEQSEYFTVDGAARTHHNTAHSSTTSSKRERYRLGIVALSWKRYFIAATTASSSSSSRLLLRKSRGACNAARSAPSLIAYDH